MTWIKRSFSATLFLLIALLSSAQQSEDIRTSPLAIAAIQYKDAYFKITYSRPSKGGREIFGKLVPYSQVWRTGANEATEITLTKDMQINGTLLRAGTYSLFTIPEKEKWTIIINKDVGLWGSYNYNPKRDEMRFDVPVTPIQGEVYEQFTIQANQRNEIADLLLLWDRLKVTIPIRFIN